MTSVVVSNLPKHEGHKNLKSGKSIFKTIGEVADLLDLPQHVLRFWESRFTEIKPLKRSGGRRYFRHEDIELLTLIKTLLYQQGLTIRGAQQWLKQNYTTRHKQSKKIQQRPIQLHLVENSTFLKEDIERFQKNNILVPHIKLDQWQSELESMLEEIDRYRKTGVAT